MLEALAGVNSGGSSDSFEGVFEVVDQGFGWVSGPEFLVQFAGDHQEMRAGPAAVFQAVEAEIHGLFEVALSVGYKAEGDPAFGDAHRAQLGSVRREVVANDGLGWLSETARLLSD